MLALTVPFVGDAAKAMFDALATAMEAAASWGVNGMVHALAATTKPDLGAGWFSGPSSPYHTMRLVVVVLGVPILLLGVMQSLLRADMGEMLRRGFLYPILAGVATLAVVAVTTVLITGTDQMSAAMLASTGHDFAKFAAQVFPVSVLAGVATADPAPAFALIALSVGVLVAGFLIWLELVVRMAAIYMAVLFMPLALVALCWQAGAGAAKRLAEFLVAVIFSKFVIAGAIAVGAAMLAAPIATSAPGAEAAKSVGGIALLALAGFAPAALLRWIPLAESAVATHGYGRRPIQAARQAASAADRAGLLAGARSPGGSANQGGPTKTGEPAADVGASKTPPGAPGVTGPAAAAAAAAARVAGQAGGVTDAAGGAGRQGTGGQSESPDNPGGPGDSGAKGRPASGRGATKGPGSPARVASDPTTPLAGTGRG